MRTLVFVPAVGLVAALLGSPTIASRDAVAETGDQRLQPNSTSDRYGNCHEFADPASKGPSEIELTRIDSKTAE